MNLKSIWHVARRLITELSRAFMRILPATERGLALSNLGLEALSSLVAIVV